MNLIKSCKYVKNTLNDATCPNFSIFSNQPINPEIAEKLDSVATYGIGGLQNTKDWQINRNHFVPPTTCGTSIQYPVFTFYFQKFGRQDNYKHKIVYLKIDSTNSM